MSKHVSEIASANDALNTLARAWRSIVKDCRAVLGSELHYQAMIYHCLRDAGLPRDQMGMNVKQFIEAPVTALFQGFGARKSIGFVGGFEPIPDIAIFDAAVAGDWRRRNRAATLRHLLLAIEVKASERDRGRLRRSEIIGDIAKLAAHREEVEHLGGQMKPVMMVIDTAPEEKERMTSSSLGAAQLAATEVGVSFFYMSPFSELAVP